jgi:hypothetical protein
MADRDPLYRQILERLSGELNGQTFEDAVCDLLHDTFPSLVPIRGGSDAGRDGAIADGEGEAFPLVTTTEPDVIGNLTKSLDSYLRNGGPRRKVVLATSQELTPQRRRNLEQRAVEKGFDLAQVIERRGIADRLYRDPGWRRKLLGLAGTPAALSAVPHSKRPFLELAPVGRDEDLTWLRTTPGDRVLSGQPGSGKTFLLQHLIREGWPALFLVSRDETEIADALRAQEPGFVVIVDDAHTDPDLLVRLRRLRLEIGDEFSILATTWVRNLDSVIEALGFPTAMRELELLTRLQILEIYQQAGITEDNTDRSLVYDLVDQASNRPGLAATLALLWLRGAGREVLTGRALSRHVRETFRSVIGDAAPLLAAFSLGGDRGMPLQSVAEIYGLSLAELWRQTVDLAAGGALCQVEREVLAVRPHQLRSALIGTVFFPDPGQGPALPYRPFLDRAPSFGSAVEALVRARNYGVPVPDTDLRELVSRANALDPWRKVTADEPGLGELILHSDVLAAWKGLTLSSEENARWVLEHYPREVLHLAHEALLSSPQSILPHLLARVPEFGGSFHSHWGHPLRILERWIREPLAAPQESMRRRRLLAQEIVRYLRGGGDPSVGLQALSPTLSPKLETSSLDPGIGNEVLLQWAVLPKSSLPELGNLWAAVRGVLSSLPLKGWPSLARVLSEWVDPQHIAPGIAVSEETRRILQDLAASMIGDLVPLVRTSPGIVSALRPFAERLGLPDDSLPLDPVFEILFPEPDFEALPEPDMTLLDELAESWSRDSPRDVARRLTNYEHEARQIDRRWPRHTPQICRELAARIDAPIDWLNAFFEQSLPADLAEPFLLKVLSHRPEGWEILLERWLDSESWSGTMASLLARVSDLPRALAEKTLARLEADPRLTYILALRNEICHPMLRTLFLSSNLEAALAAAVGAWSAHPRSIPPDLAGDWRNAALRAGTEIDDRSLLSSLAQVLAANPALAFDWLRARIQTGSISSGLFLPSAQKGPFPIALSVLDPEQRSILLAELAPSPSLKELLPHLIGKNVALYRQLLEREDLREYQLAPLQGTPDPEWIPLALAAAESGWGHREIAREALWGVPVYSFWGSGVEHWSRWKESFATLEANPHEEIRAIARVGQELVEPLIEKARREERKIALQGL